MEEVSWKIGFMTGLKGYSEEQYKFRNGETLVRFSPISLEVKESSGKRQGCKNGLGPYCWNFEV